MRVLTVVGNRPQFVKAAAVSSRLRSVATEVLVHTGQHYDDALSRVFFDELELPRPEHRFDLGGGSNTAQTARMLTELAPLLASEKPDVVLVYGDTNSTLAGALAAAQAGVPVAHVEAGMRSFDRSMPEEVNRIETDELSSLLLCSSQTAVDNLASEGVGGRVELVGDVMVDIALLLQPRARDDLSTLQRLELQPGAYVLMTAHRAGNVDDPARLERLVELIEAMPGIVVLPLHPRTRARLEEAGILLRRLEEAGNVLLLPPVGYLEFTSLLVHARAMLTDSGGVQKEAYLAGVPCVTLRDTTEWVETVEAGWNRLVGLDPDAAAAALKELPEPGEATSPAAELYGGGQAGSRVAAAIAKRFG